ncbi:MAG: hypothetical protein DRO96_01345 [Candidatus Aenigmatarchaeota archaeon]|nr:MAG: hypothetical protein DRO96_01345 [Candidatus Aenigmarchaeota archaeon]
MKKTFTIYLAIVLFFSVVAIAFASSKAVEQFDVELVKSGTLYISGDVKDVYLDLYIPQKGLENIEVSPNNYEKIKDEYNNAMIRIHWNNLSGIEKYRVKFKIKSEAKHYRDTEFMGYWYQHLEKALEETPLTKQTDEMRRLAYGNETDMEKLIRLTTWAKKNLRYERDPKKRQTKSSDWMFKYRRGACGEYANLLTALLRSAGIPVRYVVGYAYSPETTNATALESHAWVEALVDGRWIPADPTWLEVGYLDATHIPFAYLQDSNFTESIHWRGSGTVQWKKNAIEYSILSIKEREPRILAMSITPVCAGEYGLITLDVAEHLKQCSMADIAVQSCVDNMHYPVLEIRDERRMLWLCPDKTIYWLFRARDLSSDYKCVVTAFDQSGATVEKEILVAGKEETEQIALDAPDQVLVNQQFAIKSKTGGLFFSPNLTDAKEGREWRLVLKTPGRYKFYFYSPGFFAEKDIDVVTKKETSLYVYTPEHVIAGQNFSVIVNLRNLLNKRIFPTVRVIFYNQTLEDIAVLQPLEDINLTFKLRASKPGRYKFVALAESDYLSSYTTAIDVEEQKTIVTELKKTTKSLLKKIFSFFELFGQYLKSVLEKYI